MTRYSLLFAKAQADLEYLRYEHYQDDDIRAIVEVVGSKLERFFRARMLPILLTG